MRHLQLVQTWAADRWDFVPHPRLYRHVRVRRDRLGAALKFMVLAVALWWIWAPVLLGVAVFAVALLGSV